MTVCMYLSVFSRYVCSTWKLSRYSVSRSHNSSSHAHPTTYAVAIERVRLTSKYCGAGITTTWISPWVTHARCESATEVVYSTSCDLLPSHPTITRLINWSFSIGARTVGRGNIEGSMRWRGNRKVPAPQSAPHFRTRFCWRCRRDYVLVG